MKTHIVNVSSGLASAEALERTIARVGIDHTIGVFADVKGNSTSEHAGEDADNYRFLADIERWFGIEIVRIVEGRDTWQAMFDARVITLPIGKTKVARCSICFSVVAPWAAWHCNTGDRVSALTRTMPTLT